MTDAGSIPTAEGVGGTVGEAKWQAVRELKMRFPGLVDAEVAFEAVEEDAGVGSVRVVARADLDRWRARNEEFEPTGDASERVRELVERIVASLGVAATVAVAEDEERLEVRVDGSELGLFIGKRGQTIDAVQLLAGLSAYRGLAVRKRVVVDAGGYRERREGTLRRQADRAAASAVGSGNEVELAPMPAGERRVVHVHLADRSDVETFSVGDEPDRCVVVSPLS